MSETFPLNHNIGRLPDNFLGVDWYRLKDSAERTRSMEDLRQGLERCNFLTRDSVEYGCRPYEDPDAARHVYRGAALTRLLLENSASLPDFFDGLGLSLEESQASPAADWFTAARDTLVEARRKAVLSPRWEALGIQAPEETARYKEMFEQQVDRVLEKAGLGDFFDVALTHLTGEGLEEPTRPMDAKYGAALAALGVGLSKAGNP